jgi:hypothetical protein
LKPFAASAALAAGIDFPTTDGTLAVSARGGLVGVVAGLVVGLADVLGSGVGSAVGAEVSEHALTSSKDRRTAAARMSG